MERTDVLILGGGLAGLACRAGLGGVRETLVLEKTDRVGGLIKVYPRGDYTFDTTVHVIFFRDPNRRAALLDLLPMGVHTFDKENDIWQYGVRITYPYQHHAAELPAPVRDECLAGFLDNPHAGRGPIVSYHDWLLAQFGEGFYRHFFGPYNLKLYGVPLEQLEAAPMIWTIPADDREAVIRGAARPPNGRPPTVTCFYPRGPLGISALARGLRDLFADPILHHQEAARVDLARREVTTDGGEVVRYRNLVSSLPLPELLRRIDDVPQAIEEAARTLAVAPLTVIRVGARETGDALTAHWTYFPEPEVPFYRIIRLEQISPDLAPPGGCALLLECSGRVEADREGLLRYLAGIGVLRRPEADVFESIYLPYGYTLFLHGHRPALDRIFAWLAGHGVQSVGRFGEWFYANMETTIVSGLKAARALQPPGDPPSDVLRRFGMA